MTSRIAVIGVGNPWRRDDGVGWVVADEVGRRLGPAVAVVASDGEPSRLLDAWTGVDLAVVVDAVRSDAAPGTIHVLSDELVPDRVPPRSGSHALGLGDAIALGRALDRLPARLVVVAVEAEDTDAGHGLSPSVEDVVDEAADTVARVVAAFTASCG